MKERLAGLAREALTHAYSPYSSFRVGAALETDSGEVFTGCNVENASFGLTICAERTALAAAVSAGYRNFRQLVIVTEGDEAVAPCGACRQVLVEFGEELEVHSVAKKEKKRWLLRELIPGAFRLSALLAVGLLAACQIELPTLTDDDLVPDSRTVEVTIPFEDFITNSEVYGGYGRTSELGGGFIAYGFGESSEGEQLQAATLLRLTPFPLSAPVSDTTGTTRPDSALTYLSAKLVAAISAEGSVAPGPVEVIAYTLEEDWHPATATWELAIDSLGVQVPWPAAGGGGGDEIGRAMWDPTSTDSLTIPIDSAQTALWADTATMERSLRLATPSSGVRLRMQSAILRLEAQPSLNPDTLIQVAATTRNLAFIYTPVPAPPQSGYRVGGAPAWRTVLGLDIPRQVTGPPELCADVGCPLAVTEDRVSYAGLRLTSKATSRAFAPSDTLAIDLRMVLAPDFLPKSPLGPSTRGLGGQSLPPEWFSSPAGEEVEMTMTGVVRDILRGETLGGEEVSGTVALLSALEPLSIEYLSFFGAESALAPNLRLILTLGGQSDR